MIGSPLRLLAAATTVTADRGSAAWVSVCRVHRQSGEEQGCKGKDESFNLHKKYLLIGIRTTCALRRRTVQETSLNAKIVFKIKDFRMRIKALLQLATR
jgi:hypothetical protein